MNTVLIIENQPNDFSNIKNLLEDKFDCNIYPKNNIDFLEEYIFNLVEDYKKNETPTDFSNLDSFIEKKGIQYILIDINLSRNLSETEGFGKVLYDYFSQSEVLKKVLKFTKDPDSYTIHKTYDLKMLEDDIIAKLGFSAPGVPDGSGTPDVPSNVSNDYSLLLKKYNNLRNSRNIEITLVVFAVVVFLISIAYHFFPAFDGYLTHSIALLHKHYYLFFIVLAPFLFYQLRNRWKTKIDRKDDIEIYKDNLDFNITLFFHQAITVSFVVSAFIFIYNISEHLVGSSNILKFSEYLFLTFLPILITLSFYFFYVKSLRSIIVGRNETSLDEGSKLMEISKTFFISSLVSYLLVKVIELISDKGELIEHRIKELGKLNLKTANELKLLLENNNFFQIMMYLILIVLLIFFYLKIKHKADKETE